MASLSTCHLGLWLGWQILLNLVKDITAIEVFYIIIIGSSIFNTSRLLRYVMLCCVNSGHVKGVVIHKVIVITMTSQPPTARVANDLPE